MPNVGEGGFENGIEYRHEWGGEPRREQPILNRGSYGYRYANYYASYYATGRRDVDSSRTTQAGVCSLGTRAPWEIFLPGRSAGKVPLHVRRRDRILLYQTVSVDRCSTLQL